MTTCPCSTPASPRPTSSTSTTPPGTPPATCRVRCLPRAWPRSPGSRPGWSIAAPCREPPSPARLPGSPLAIGPTSGRALRALREHYRLPEFDPSATLPCRSGVGATTPFFVSSGGAERGCPGRGPPVGANPCRGGGVRARGRGIPGDGRPAHRSRSPRSPRRSSRLRLRSLQPAALGLSRYEPDRARAIFTRSQLAGDRSASQVDREPRAVSRETGGLHHLRGGGGTAPL